MAKSTQKKVCPVMVQGTSSHAGKSVLVAALCRIFRDMGLKVAPFKAQNMALNSFVTADGSEIGVAQAFQAEAAGIEPAFDMNPILLKPTADSSSQVVIHGRVFGNMTAREYHAFKKEARKYVVESYRRLASSYDIIVIEGAGSPAEINLRDNDIANMGVAEITDSPVLLVGDIDRGGVFASLVGTIELLAEGERERVKGFIINRFRGDLTLLTPGLDILRERTGVPVLGVVPYVKDALLPDEDSVALEGRKPAGKAASGVVAVKVIKLPRISNFTDFDPFRRSPGVELSFIDTPEEMEGAGIVIIPGSKNTLGDLKWLKERGFERALKGHIEKGGMVAGICGGLQMLGRKVLDPHGVESGEREARGLNFLDAETTLERVKKTFQVEAESFTPFGEERFELRGYEIHMGDTATRERPFSVIKKRSGEIVSVKEGCVSRDGSVWGTYIHGVFDNDSFRCALMNEIRRRRGLEPLDASGPPFRASRESSIAAFSKVVRESIDMERVLTIMGLEASLAGISQAPRSPLE